MRLDELLQGELQKHWDAEAQRAKGKSVVLVEGESDRILVEAVFTARRRTWPQRIAVVPCGGRTKVLQALESSDLPMQSSSTSLHLVGLVDRDT